MKNSLLFDFTINKEKNIIEIKKEFAAGLELVWDAWTKAELLDKWWAPLPYRNETIYMNFSPGGYWHYVMISPKGEKHYCKAYYQSISTRKAFSYKDAFCNEQGEDIQEMPGMNWTNTFTSHEATTIVEVLLQFESVEALENIIKLGFKEGFTMAIGNLEDLLETILSRKITVKTKINAHRNKVWSYYNSPEHITRWNFADPSWHCPRAENNMIPGGKYNARMEAKDGSFGFDFEAIYKEINEGKNFRYEFGGREAKVEFIDDDMHTEVIICFDPENENPLEMQQAGWQAILNNFKDYTEKN